MASIRVSVLQAIIQNLPNPGGRLKSVLARHGLSDARIGNPSARVDIRDYLEFFEDAARTFEDPVLGARLGFELRPGDLWPMGLLLMQASSISSALGYYARYATAFQTATTFSVQSAPEGLVCSYKIHSEIKPAALLRQDNEFTLACICSQLRTAFDRNWRPLEVQFEHPSNGNDGSLQRIFGAPVRFGQTRNCIVVDRKEADTQHRIEDREFISILNQQMGSVVASNNEDLSVTEQVRALVSVRIGIAPLELPHLASELGMTARTLQRRLAAEGTSLRNILQNQRERMAAAYLAQRNLTVEEISSALGYAEATVFTRAYKAWTGRNPVRNSSSECKASAVDGMT